MATKRRLVILYGSQTGYSKEVAQRISRESKRYHFKPYLQFMDGYERHLLPTESLVIFVCSTTGQGDTPENMKRFWRFLRRKDIPRDSLVRLNFTVFGLGDSGYPIYNAVARRLYQRLLNLGGQSVYPRGLGDDQHKLGYDGGLDPWLEGLWKKLLVKFPFPPGIKILPKDLQPLAIYNIQVSNYMPESNYVLTEADKKKKGNLSKENKLDKAIWFGEGKQRYQPYMARIITNERLTAIDNAQDVRHIELDITNTTGQPHFEYEPGDVVAIHPRNMPEPTAVFIQALGLKPDAMLTITTIDDEGVEDKKQKGIDWPPQSCTVRDLFEFHLDIFGTPRRYFFEFLSHFATNAIERERLQEFSSSEYQDEMYKYCIKEKRTYLEIFTDFPSAHPPLHYLLQMIPRLQPRLFSISSSPLAHPGQIHITLAIVKFKTPYGRFRTGVCSEWLASLHPDQNLNTAPPLIPITIIKGSIRMPKDQACPVILVGPGTGIAPFRSMIHERIASLQQDYASKNYSTDYKAEQYLPKLIVYFGNRHEKGDFLYNKEWKKFNEEKFITLHTAFSRDTDKKVYVQHRLAENADEVWEVLSRGGYFLLAGNAKQMPIDVRNTVMDIIKKKGNFSDEKAKRFMLRLDQERRYQSETWA